MNHRILLSLFFSVSILTTGSCAQTAAGTKVDWTMPASTVDQLEAQLRAWQVDYNLLVKNSPVTPDLLKKVLVMNLQRGYLTSKGFVNLKESWDSDFSKSVQLTKYTAIYAKFQESGFEVSLSGVPRITWSWGDLFSPPLGTPKSKSIFRLSLEGNAWTNLKPILPENDFGSDTAGTFYNEELSPKQRLALRAGMAKILEDFIIEHNPGIARGTFVNLIDFLPHFGPEVTIKFLSGDMDKAEDERAVLKQWYKVFPELGRNEGDPVWFENLSK